MKTAFILCSILIGVSSLSAHKLEVAKLRLEELGESRYALKYEVPLGQEAVYPAPILPEGFVWEMEPAVRPGPLRLTFFSTERPLAAGDRIELRWQRQGVLASAIWKSGATAREYFPISDGVITVELSQLRAGSGSWQRTATRYFPLGVQHILKGIDHLFFVAGLLLLVQGPRPLALTISAFTLAHSLSLGLSVFGFFRIDSGIVDLLVALSIVFMGSEIIRKQRAQTTLASRHPWLIAFAFGLVHGLGFAGALESLGLPNESIPLVLLFFNLGVEAGQLLFAAVWLLAVTAASSLRMELPPSLRLVPAYALGAAATVWCIERSLALFQG